MSYKAGTASVCITPEEPLWLAGYAARTAPARGKISDLYASALALEDETGQRFVIVSADVIAITPTIADAVGEAVCSRHRLSRQRLLLTASHTHYAPEFRPDKQVFFNIPAEYALTMSAFGQTLVAALIQAINQAFARFEPVQLFARKTSTHFAHNRRRHGVVAGTPSADDTVDHDVPVLDCVNESGKRAAIVFGYACHNTTIEPDDLRYCGDWAGFACEELQEAYPGATILFIPGAGADQDPEPRGSVELSRRYGHEIATAVQEALNAPGIEITGPIRAEMEEVALELEPVTSDRLTTMLNSADPPQCVKAQFLLDALSRGEELITSYAAPIQVARFGNELLMIALSGEPVVDWSQKIKHAIDGRASLLASRGSAGAAPSRFSLIWVAGYCNDMFGYLPTRRIQQEGGYEGGRANLWSAIPAPFAGDVEDRIMAAVRRLVERVSR